MSLVVKLKRFRIIRCNYEMYARCEFRGSAKYTDLLHFVGKELLAVDHIFEFEVIEPITSGEVVIIQLMASAKMGTARSVGIYQLGLHVLVLEGQGEFIGNLVDENNTFVPVLVEMAVFYNVPYTMPINVPAENTGFRVTEVTTPKKTPKKKLPTVYGLGQTSRRNPARASLVQAASSQSSVHSAVAEVHNPLQSIDVNMSSVERSVQNNEVRIDIDSDEESRRRSLKIAGKRILRRGLPVSARKCSSKSDGDHKREPILKDDTIRLAKGRNDEEQGLLNMPEPSIESDRPIRKTSISSDELPNNRPVRHPPKAKRIKTITDVAGPSALKPAYFQICVSVIEVKQLAGLNLDPVVCVEIGDERKYTSTKESTSCPYYNEYFVFDFHLPPITLLEKIITLSVFHSRTFPRANKLVGNFKLDVATLWSQPDRQFYHKWALLTDPNDVTSGPKGYLKCDISVTGKGDTIKIPPERMDKDEDDIDTNLLLPDGVNIDRQRTRYIVNIHKADGLPKMNYSVLANVKQAFTGEEIQVNPYVEVSFAGKTGKTTVKRNCCAPEWNEQIVFMDMFPPLCQRIKITMRDHVPVKPNDIGTHVIDMRNISHDGQKGFLPTFGPAHIYFYGSTRTYSMLNQNSELCKGLGEGVAYRARLLISIRLEILENIEFPLADVEIKPIAPITDSIEKHEEFFLFASIFDAQMIDKKLTDKPIYFELSIGNAGNTLDGVYDSLRRPHELEGIDLDEVSSDMGFWHSTTYPCKAESQDNTYYYLPFLEEKPCLHVRSVWPNQCRRMYNSNLITAIVDKLEKGLSDAQSAINLDGDASYSTLLGLKCVLASVSTSCSNYVKDMTNVPPIGNTKLNREWQRLCLSEIDQLSAQIQILKASVTRQSIKDRIRTGYTYLDRLKHLSEDPQQTMPDIFLWMISNRERLAYYRFNPKDIVYSECSGESGKYCGKLQTVFLKTYQMRAYIYQARSLIGSASSGLSDPFARVIIGNSSAPTQVIDETLNPTWDELLVFSNVILFSTVQYVKTNPPTIVIEIFDQDKVRKSEFIGRTLARPRVKAIEDAYESPEFPPSLEWYDITRGDGRAGELLAAFELLEISGKEQVSLLPQLPPAKNVMKKFVEDARIGPIYPIPQGIRPTLSRYRIEVLFWGLRDMKPLHLTSIDKPRVEIECCGHVIYSSVIQNAKCNPNFQNPVQYIDVELPDQDVYRPPLTIRVVDCRTFGRSVLAGTHTINSIRKHVYIPKTKSEKFIEARIKSFIPLQNVDLHSTGIIQDNAYTVEIEKESCPLLSQQGRVTAAYGTRQPGATNTNKKFNQNKMRRLAASMFDSNNKRTDWWSKYFGAMVYTIEELLESQDFQQDPQPSTSAACVEQAGSSTDEEDFPWSEPNRNKCKLNSSPNAKTRPRNKKIPKSALPKIYPHELEAVPEYEGFQEWLQSFPIYRGKTTGNEAEDETRVVGVFKGAIKVYKWPIPKEKDDHTIMGFDPHNGYFQGVPNNEPTRVLVRVYIVKAIDLHPMDKNGKADPYIVLQHGSKSIGDKDHVSNQLNPVFGKCYEFEATFPQDSMLSVQVVDWNLVGSDDLIGETKIDLENRFYSRHRATCGLPEKYEEHGYNRWRDALTPTQILAKLCNDGKLDQPIYENDCVKIGNITFNMPMDDIEIFSNPETLEEQMALMVLHRWQEVPRVGTHLVTEHVETRSLYNPNKPGIEQGRLEMWVDMFPMDMPPPGPPIDISPRKPKSYEMRVTVLNTDDVVLKDNDSYEGENISDIYVKGWLRGPDDCQTTDIHHNSLAGEGNFNWRFIYPFDYLEAEQRIVLSRKESMFSWDETQCKIPARLHMQVWDCDHFAPDDFLGALTLDLNRFPRGARSSKQCSLEMLRNDGTVPMVNLFRQKRIRGWWPIHLKHRNAGMELTGKVEVEIHLLTNEEAEKTPAGYGRNAPDPLEKPNRPDPYFLWFLNPLKTFRYIMWHNYKCRIITYVIIFFVSTIIFVLLYTIPVYIVKRFLGA